MKISCLFYLNQVPASPETPRRFCRYSLFFSFEECRLITHILNIITDSHVFTAVKLKLECVHIHLLVQPKTAQHFPVPPYLDSGLSTKYQVMAFPFDEERSTVYAYHLQVRVITIEASRRTTISEFFLYYIHIVPLFIRYN